MRDKLHRLGKFLSNMILPNISAFIVWGFLTALFMPEGWLPNNDYAKVIEPMTKYLLPLLIGYTGGKLINNQRGGVLGAIGTIGLITGTSVPMFAGAMVIGPLGGYLSKLLDGLLHKKVPAGFEMLIRNFSEGFLGLCLLLGAYHLVGPMMTMGNEFASEAMTWIIDKGYIILASVVIEPAKVLFLNNVINHGVLSPLGMNEAALHGKSILFLLETNPGPGLGVLLAYGLFEKGNKRALAPSAVVIHFLGGIHEVYFPFVLANPLLILPIIAGSISGIFTFEMLNIGLTATPSPGSIFSLLALSPKGMQLGVLAGVMASAGITFLFSGIVMRKITVPKEVKTEVKIHNINKIVFACDAGMGSSVMAAKQFQKQLIDQNAVEVVYCPIEQTPDDAQLIIVHERLKCLLPSQTKGQIMVVKDFLHSPSIESLIKRINNQSEKGETKLAFFKKKDTILSDKRITTGLKPTDKATAIRHAGQALLEEDLIETGYIDAMLAREEIATTYIGSNVAIPHGTKAGKAYVKKTGIIIHQYPEGVDFGEGNIAKLVIAIAASGDEHMDILMKIADAVSNKETLDYLTQESDVKKIYQTFLEKGLGGNK